MEGNRITKIRRKTPKLAVVLVNSVLCFVLQAFLFGAWICISVYLTPFKLFFSDPKAKFFQGITVFSWVMVILIDLTFALSFDKICRRSSRWTLGVRRRHFQYIGAGGREVEKWTLVN